MEQIVIYIKDKEKAEMLFKLLTALDFVDLVNKSSDEEISEATTIAEEEISDFFSMAGLWAGRDVSLESIHQKAWPRQQP